MKSAAAWCMQMTIVSEDVASSIDTSWSSIHGDDQSSFLQGDPEEEASLTVPCTPLLSPHLPSGSLETMILQLGSPFTDSTCDMSAHLVELKCDVSSFKKRF